MAIQIWRDIGQLLTLQGVAHKSGRFVQDKDLSLIEQAAIVVSDGLIEWVGLEKDLPKSYISTQGVEEISFAGRTLMPAFVESHTHSVFAGDRSDEFEMRNRGVSYQEIAQKGGGILSTVEATRRASFEELVVRGQKVADQFLSQGVTTLEIKSGYCLDKSGELKMLEVVQALKGVRTVPTFLGPHAIPPEFKSSGDYMDYLLTEVLPEVHGRGLARRGDIFIENGYFSVEEGRRYLQKLCEMGWDIAVHADQLSRTGASVLALESGALSVDHVIEVSAEDVERLAAGKTTCVLLPSADFYIHCPYPPARDLLDKGARVALATDYNPGSSPSWDLSLVGVLARLQMKMTLPEVLAAYTFNAACALGLESDLGSVETGKKADLIVLDGDWRELFYQVGQRSVASVYKSGKKVFEV